MLDQIEWRQSTAPVAYLEAVAAMEARVAAIRAGTEVQQVWLLEHPALYTAGTSAKDTDLIDPAGLPVYRTGRGGQFTYHGPGQRVAYVMLDLHRRGSDLRRYIYNLEEWLIRALAVFNVKGERLQGRVGVWATRDHRRADKIAAIGVRVRHWVTYHGIAINLDPNLSHFSGIVPCGVDTPDYGVTSLANLNSSVTMAKLDRALKNTFAKVFQVPTKS